MRKIDDSDIVWAGKRAVVGAMIHGALALLHVVQPSLAGALGAALLALGLFFALMFVVRDVRGEP